MSDITNNNQEPARLIETINDLAAQGIGSPAAAEQEAARKQAANLVDAANAVRDTSEQRAELIERAQGGEAIDPLVMKHAGELALEARLNYQQQAENNSSHNNT